MNITNLLEEINKYEEVVPTKRQKELGSLIEDLFKGIIVEQGLTNKVEVDNRTCWKDDLGEDYPEVRVFVGTETDPNEPFFVSYIFPCGSEEDIKNNLETCPLTVSLYSDVFGLDELFPLDEEGTTEDEQISKLAETIKAEFQ